MTFDAVGCFSGLVIADDNICGKFNSAMLQTAEYTLLPVKVFEAPVLYCDIIGQHISSRE